MPLHSELCTLCADHALAHWSHRVPTHTHTWTHITCANVRPDHDRAIRRAHARSHMSSLFGGFSIAFCVCLFRCALMSDSFLCIAHWRRAMDAQYVNEGNDCARRWQQRKSERTAARKLVWLNVKCQRLFGRNSTSQIVYACTRYATVSNRPVIIAITHFPTVRDEPPGGHYQINTFHWCYGTQIKWEHVNPHPSAASLHSRHKAT